MGLGCEDGNPRLGLRRSRGLRFAFPCSSSSARRSIDPPRGPSARGLASPLARSRRRLAWPTIHSNLVSHRRERQAPRRHRRIRRRVSQRPSPRIPGVSPRRLRSPAGVSPHSNPAGASPRRLRSPAGVSPHSNPAGASPRRLRSPAGVSPHSNPAGASPRRLRSPAGVSPHSSPVGVSPRRLRSPVGVSPRNRRSSRSPLSQLRLHSPSSLSSRSPLGASRLHSNRPGASPRNRHSNLVGVNLLSNPAIPPPATGCPAMGWVRRVPGSPCRTCPSPRC
jgi:hypothetical protein